MSIPKNSSPLRYGRDCTCGATKLCNLTDCRYPWAVKLRQSIRPGFWARITGWVVAYFTLWKRWERH